MGVSSTATEFNFSTKSLKSSIKLKHDDSGVALKLKHGLPGNKVALEMSGKRWEASYDLKSKDITLERKWKLRTGELKIKQKVPGGQSYLVPSPEVQWKTHLVKNKKFEWEVEPSYCMQSRVAKLEQTLEFGKRTKVKVDYAHKPASRPVVQLSFKPGNKWAKQLSIKGDGVRSARLTHEMEPTKKIQIKTSIGTQPLNDIRLQAEIKPGKIAGVKPKLTLETKMSSKSRFIPSNVVAGISLDL